MKTYFFLAIALVLGLASCSSNDSSTPLSSTGNLSVKIAFTEPPTRAYSASTAIPSTSWASSVKDLIMVLTDGSSVIQYAIPVSLSSATGIAAETRTFTNIPVGTYTVTLIANAGQSNIVTTGYASGWTPANMVGQNLNTLILGLKASTNYTPVTGETGYTGYQSPAEIFTAAQSGVAITADATTTVATPFSLTRIVSLLRVRIDKSQFGNSAVSFVDPAADLRIRYATTSYNIATGVNTTTAATNVLYTGGGSVFHTSEPASGYSTGTILDPANNITLWCDVVMFPGGSTSDGTKKFNIVLSGMAPVGYVPKGTTVALTTATRVYWSGQVQQAVLSNNIIEVNCALNSAGATTFAAASSYGTLAISIALSNWNAIIGSTIPM